MKLIYFIPLMILTASSCSNKQQNKGNGPLAQNENTVFIDSAQQKNAAIQMGQLSEQKIDEMILLNGLVEVPPQNIISVSFPLGGYLKATKLLPGMYVSRGENIGVIEDQGLIQLQQDYLIAKAKLVVTRQEFERQKVLNETKTAADKVFEQAQAEYESTKVLVMGLAEKLRLININPDKLTGNSISRMVNITSPINGFVSKVNVNIGKYVQPQDVLFELINPTDIHAALTVFEKDLNKIQKGQKVKISFVDLPDTKYDAEVMLITKNVDENRSGIVHCHFEKMPPDLKPGMFIHGLINISNIMTAALPEEAVVRFENKEYVFITKNKDQFEAVPVQTGKRNNQWIEILTPLDSIGKGSLVTKNAFAVLSAWKNVSEE